MIYEKAYAKINLALAVGKEENGYHQVANLMQPISLYDELFFEKSAKTEIQCEIDIQDNICLKAIELFKEKYHITEHVTIILNKHIPIMAGLAGGSSDAAATLRGLNRLFEVDAPLIELDELARELGSDVPFFLYNKLALCTGRGEIVNPLEDCFVDMSLLIIKPSFGLSTKEVYQKYHFDGISKQPELNYLLQAIKNHAPLDEFIFNDLEAVALESNVALKQLFEQIKSLGYTPHISGSGPSIFILDSKQVDLENIKKLDGTLSLRLCNTI